MIEFSDSVYSILKKISKANYTVYQEIKYGPSQAAPGLVVFSCESGSLEQSLE